MTRRLPRGFLLLVVVAAAIAPSVGAQRKPDNTRPPWADTTGESNVYPIGDAVGVYRAVLDLLYVDGRERPPVIVLWDTAGRQSGGPCVRPCKEGWPHKSKIDTATILAYTRQSPKRPRIVHFEYRIPIVGVSSGDFERMGQDGYGYLADRPPNTVGPVEAFWAGFRRKYPRAWGYAMLSKVGFNRRHTEALIGVFQVCGQSCRSFETVFLKCFGKQWRVIERIPEYADGMQAAGNFRYRGPAGERQDQSQLVATDASGSPPRSESDDAARVYRAVLDTLYSFYGESPRTIVIKERRAYGPAGLPAHRSRVDSSTIASYAFYARVFDALYPRFKYRLPVRWVSDTALTELERQGAPLAKAAADRMEYERSPLWLAFRAKYPGAWGYASLGRVGFNPRHTQALVLTSHFCGIYCVNTDTWFLERKGDSWHVVERMPRENQSNWALDGLRYLGPETDPKAYRPRRIHGVFTDAETGSLLPKLKVEVQRMASSTIIETDAEGRYSIENLPLTPFSLMAKCPARFGGNWVFVAPVPVRPGLDSTVNVKVEFAMCPKPDSSSGGSQAPTPIARGSLTSSDSSTSSALVASPLSDTKRAMDASNEAPGLQCAPRVFSRRDTLTLRMENPHGEYLTVTQPNGTLFYLVYPHSPGPPDYQLVPSETFRKMPSIRFSADVRAVPRVYGRDTLESVFDKPGKYVLTIGSNLESERGSDIHKCTIRLAPRKLPAILSR
jgi:hypothetical protein